MEGNRINRLQMRAPEVSVVYEILQKNRGDFDTFAKSIAHFMTHPRHSPL